MSLTVALLNVDDTDEYRDFGVLHSIYLDAAVTAIDMAQIAAGSITDAKIVELTVNQISTKQLSMK